MTAEIREPIVGMDEGAGPEDFLPATESGRTQRAGIAGWEAGDILDEIRRRHGWSELDRAAFAAERYRARLRGEDGGLD